MSLRLARTAHTSTTTHGIDLTAPGGVAALLAFHRATFGDTRMEAGTGDGAAAAGGQPAGTPRADGVPPATSAPAGTPPPADQPPADGWDGKVESLPEPVQKMIRELRQENGNRRTALTAAEQQQKDVVRAFAKAAGIELPGDEQAPDPAALTQQLTATQAQARQAAVELAVYRAAGTHQGDPNALLDSRAFLTKVGDLDPTANDFAAKVDAAIKDAVTTNPKLKTGRVPGSSSVDAPGGQSGVPRTPIPLDQAVNRHYSG